MQIRFSWCPPDGDFWSERFLLFLTNKLLQYFLTSFESSGLSVQEELRIDFQDGGHGSHSGFPIRTILAIFDLQITLILCVEVLWPVNPNGSYQAWSVYLTTLLLAGLVLRQLTSIVHILSPETDNCISWISRRERMTVENSSWSNLHERMLPTWRGSNPQPPDRQSDEHPVKPLRSAHPHTSYQV